MNKLLQMVRRLLNWRNAIRVWECVSWMVRRPIVADSVKITIVVPLYNEERFVRECLDSVRRQSWCNWECLIVDDASTDGGPAVAEEFCRRDDRFRLIRHSENRGLPAARNSGIAEAKGEFITFLDSDDWLVQHSLMRRARRLCGCADRQEVGGVFSEVVEVPERFPLLYFYIFPLLSARKKEVVTFLSSNGQNPFLIHQAVLKTEALVDSGGFDVTKIRGAEDYYFWMSFLRSGYVMVPCESFSGIYRQKMDSMARLNCYNHFLTCVEINDWVFNALSAEHKALDARALELHSGEILVFTRSLAYYISLRNIMVRGITYSALAYGNQNEEDAKKIISQIPVDALRMRKYVDIDKATRSGLVRAYAARNLAVSRKIHEEAISYINQTIREILAMKGS